MDQPIDFQKQLAEAKKNYILAVRWLKEAIGYKATMAGTEWQDDGQELITDSEKAVEEAKFDVLYWRKQMTKIQKEIKKGNKRAGK
jgi:hypothetical protein